MTPLDKKTTFPRRKRSLSAFGPYRLTSRWFCAGATVWKVCGIRDHRAVRWKLRPLTQGSAMQERADGARSALELEYKMRRSSGRFGGGRRWHYIPWHSCGWHRSVLGWWLGAVAPPRPDGQRVSLVARPGVWFLSTTVRALPGGGRTGGVRAPT